MKRSDIMSTFEKLNKINGFDFKNPINAKQNNYAWSMAELGDYIYVGTGRNVPWIVTKLLSPDAEAPLLISTTNQDNNAEIWRYKKDGSRPWQRVYKAKTEEQINGFRFMIVHAMPNSTPALYAASLSFQGSVAILKSTDGSNWTRVGGDIKGTSSRSMVSFNGMLYVAVLDEAIGGNMPLLYRSKDPEFFDFELVFDPEDSDIDPEKNPIGGINNIVVFNKKLYVCISTSQGIEVWRSNSGYPKKNDWTLVADKGFGDALNDNAMAVGVYKDYLYVTATKKFPLTLLVPFGADMIRIDKFDNWELVVGGLPIIPTKPSTGRRNKALSGYGSGFFNPFNVYIWQVMEYDGKLLATTFDHGTNIENLRDIVLLNKEFIIDRFDEEVCKLLIKIYDIILVLFKKFRYPKGFDLYVSKDGIKFEPLSLSGITTSNNYGGRILMEGSEGELYIGTANPFDGCEVLRADKCAFERYMYNHRKVNYDDSLFLFKRRVEMMLEELVIHIRTKGMLEEKK